MVEQTTREVIAKEISGGVKKGFNTASGFLSDAAKEITEDFKIIGGGLKDTFSAASGFLSGATNEIIGDLQNIFGIGKKMLTGVFSTFGKIGGSFKNLLFGGEEDSEKEQTNLLDKLFGLFRSPRTAYVKDPSAIDILNNINENIKKLSTSLTKPEEGTKTIKSVTSLSEKEAEYEKESAKSLSNVDEYFQSEEKRRAREGKEESPLKGLVDDIKFWIETALVASGIIIGAITRKIILPFELLFKSMMGLWKWVKSSGIFTIIKIGLTKFIKLFTWIDDFITKGRIANVVRKIFGTFTSIFKVIKSSKAIGIVSKTFKFMSDIFSKVFKYVKSLKNLPFIGSFIQGFAKGFSKLFIPLQIIMSTIDFFQGFFGTEGTIIEKIKGGLLRVVHDFIELPVKLLGWIVDWFLGLFNIEVEGGSAKKIMDSLMGTVSFALDVIILPFKIIKNSIDKLIDIVSYIKTDTNLFEDIATVLKSVFSAIIFPFKVIWSGLKILWYLFTGDLSSVGEEIKGLFETIVNTFKTVFKGLWKAIEYSPIGLAYKGIKFLWNFLTSSKKDDKQGFISILLEKLKSIGSMIKNYLLSLIPGKEFFSNLFGGEKLPENIKQNVEKEKNKKLTDVEKSESKKFTKNLADEKVINLNWFGKSKIKNWDEIEKLKPQEIQKVLNYNDWNDNTVARLIKLRDKKSKGMIDQNINVGESIRKTENEEISMVNKTRQQKQQNKLKEKEDSLQLQKEMKNASRQQTQQLSTINNSISSLNNNLVNSAKRNDYNPIPDEIENMSILFLNKNNIGVAS